LRSLQNGRSDPESLGTRRATDSSAARVLICDDVADIRMLMRLTFETTPDFEVVGEATNGADGILAARKLRPDAILLDVHMPVKSGLDALPELRAAVPDAAIVMFTGFEEWSLRDHTEGDGADGYIEKGAGVNQILELVRSLVQARRNATRA
jgi:DNA-binding NarL/FixJ family response regulator